MTSSKTIKKILFLKMKKRWPGHVKDVLEKNVLYRIVSAKIVKYKYAYVTLVSVKPVLDEDKTIETFFSSLQTKEFMDYFDSENIDFQQCPELLRDLVFCYTGEVKTGSDIFVYFCANLLIRLFCYGSFLTFLYFCASTPIFFISITFLCFLYIMY
jgi:hypothetical protein